MAVKISIRPNGPYLVEGEVELVDVNGNKVETSGGDRDSRCAGAARRSPSPSVTAPIVRSVSRLLRRPSPRRRSEGRANVDPVQVSPLPLGHANAI